MNPSAIQSAASARAPGVEEALDKLPFEPAPAFRASALQDDTPFADNRGMRIGILIVTYNAVTTLTKVLKRITPERLGQRGGDRRFRRCQPGRHLRTGDGHQGPARSCPSCTVLSAPKNLGYGGNQKAGYRYFMEKGFDVVVLLHGDGQYAPEILSHLYHPIVAGEADAVFGSRMMKTYGGPLKGGMPLYKYAGNRILSVFENAALGLNLTEFHSGYRAYSLAALRKIDFSAHDRRFPLRHGNHHQAESPGIHRFDEVPIPTYYGNEICYVNGMKYARDVFRAVRRYKQTCRSVACYPEFRRIFRPLSDQAQQVFQPRLRAPAWWAPITRCWISAAARAFFAAEIARAAIASPASTIAWRPLTRGYSSSTSAPIWTRESLPVVEQLEGKRFDRVLLLDILEHLRSPERILQQSARRVDAAQAAR